MYLSEKFDDINMQSKDEEAERETFNRASSSSSFQIRLLGEANLSVLLFFFCGSCTSPATTASEAEARCRGDFRRERDSEVGELDMVVCASQF